MARLIASAALWLALLAGPAAAGPVMATPLFTLLGSTVTVGMVARFALSIAISALSRRMAERKLRRAQQGGILTDFATTGEEAPQTFVVGRYATFGHHLTTPMTHGPGSVPNEYMTYVLAVSDLPGCSLAQLIVNEEIVPLAVAEEAMGRPATGDYAGKVWVKFFDGSQTTAWPWLVSTYGPGTAHDTDTDRPWRSDMVGPGLCYAAVTFRYDQELFSGLPQVKFVLDGIPLYDPRADSSVGGSGAQRWATPSTWAQTDNPAVMAYNVLRGIALPGGAVWGLRVPAADLPLSTWWAAMNACDQTVGGNARFRAGFEVALTSEPAALLEELLKACSAEYVEIGGVWKMQVGGPGLPVYVFTDDDVIIDAENTYSAFGSLADTYNAVTASYPEPGLLWQTKDAPHRINAAYEAEDGGRRLMANLTFPAVPYAGQVQRLMNAYLKDSRRRRAHVASLPQDASVLEPLDSVAWTSPRYGYSAKAFHVTEVGDDLGTGIQRLSLREHDPADFDPPDGDNLPMDVPSVRVRRPVSVPQGASFSGITLTDNASAARRVAIEALWDGNAIGGFEDVRWQLRRGSVEVGTGLVAAGQGRAVISAGIIPGTSYEGRLRFRGERQRRTQWTGWMPVTAPALGITDADFLGGAEEFLRSVNLSAPGYGATLPATGNWVGRMFLRTTPAPPTLFRWTGSAWTAAVDTSLLDGVLSAGNFATTLRPVEVLSALPASGNFAGRMVFLTGDGKLYRHRGSPSGAAGFSRATDGDDIDANSISAGKFVAGAIRATDIAADAIAARHLAISDFANLFPDFDLLDEDFWAAAGLASPQEFFATNIDEAGLRMVRILPQGASGSVVSRWCPCEPGTDYRASATASLGSAAAGSGTAEAVLELGRVDATGLVTQTRQVLIGQRTDNTSTALHVENLVTAADEKRFRIRFRRIGGGTATARFGAPRLTRRAGGSLVVDGAITTASMAAGSIHANRLQAGTITAGLLAASGVITQAAQIGDGIITNAKIGDTIQSDNFVSGASGAGWRIRKTGIAEFTDIVIRRQLEVASGTIGPFSFTAATSGTGVDAGSNQDWALPSQRRFVTTSPIGITAWQGARATYLANVGMSGIVIATGGSVIPDVFWGWTAEVLPLTRWSGNQSLRLKLEFWSRFVASVDDCVLTWKIYEVS